MVCHCICNERYHRCHYWKGLRDGSGESANGSIAVLAPCFLSADSIDACNGSSFPGEEFEQANARKRFLDQRDSLPGDGIDGFAHAKEVRDDKNESKEAEEKEAQAS